MPDPVNLIDSEGHAVSVPPEQTGAFLAEGYRPESDEEGVARAQQEDRVANAPGAFTAGSLAVARGLTLGLSDVAGRAIAGQGYKDFAGSAQEAHPYVSAAGNLAGAILPALVGDEAGLANLTPSGFVSGIGSKIAEAGESSLGRIGATAAAGAVEGAAQNAGSYISDVALGDRDLSAEGFLGAMGKGALYGGVAGGALSVASHGLIAARSLLPAEDLTPEGVAAAKLAARNAVSDSVDTSTQLENAGQQAVAQTDRETQQFITDLEQERAAALDEAAKQRAVEEQQARIAATPDDPMAALEQYRTEPASMPPGSEPSPIVEGDAATLRSRIADEIRAGKVPGETGPFTPNGLELATDRELARRAQTEPVSWTPPKTAKQLLAAWREKYPAGAVDLDAATAAARRQRLAEWAKGFEAKTPEDETIKAYFSDPMDPGRTTERLGNPNAPKAVQDVARKAAAEASHAAYIEATAQGANVSKSGVELMARATYAGRRAAAQAMDDVYAAYAAGKPIVDIRAAATQRFTGQLHELAEARADMIQSLAKTNASGDLLAQLQGTKAAVDAGQPLSLGERILQGVQKPIDPDEAVATALGQSKDVNEDIADIAPKITRYEAAKANLTEALGNSAPQQAQEHAQQFRAAQQQAANSNARVAAQATDNIDQTIRGVPVEKQPGGKPMLKGLAKHVSNAGAAYEALRMMGVPLPDPKGIPVIGPILSVFLKAKLASKAFGKFGGSFAATAEGTIAAKAVQVQNRISAAVGKMMDKTANVVIAHAPEISASAALGYKLFDDGKKSTPYSSEPATGNLEDLYSDRLAELSAAQQPGAIERAVKSRITTSDPTILDAIVAAETRRLQYLYNAAPKPSAPAIPGQPQQLPSRTEMLNFGIVAAAAHDPAAIFERVANGGSARPSEIDCVQNCYPQLVSVAQKKLVDMLTKPNAPLPYMRRIAVSSLIGLPMDSTMKPDHVAYLQTKPPGATPPTPPPHPTLTSSIGIGDRTLTRLDQ